MNPSEFFHHASLIACWLMFFLPLYAIIRSFLLKKRGGDSPGSRINLFVKHSILFQETFLSWFRGQGEKENIYQSIEGEISFRSTVVGSLGHPAPVFSLNGQSFEYGKGSLNPALDRLENGGVLAEGIIYQLKHDSCGRIIRICVSQEDWNTLKGIYSSASVPECSLAGF